MNGATRSAERKMQIILLGTSGSGKSATGNTILGEKKFKSLVSDQSITINIQTEIKTIYGIEIAVTDTPGLHCTRLPEADVHKKLKDLTSSLEGPYAFLLVISTGSFTAREIDTVSKLKQVLGESFLSHTFIAFSHSDDLEFKTTEEFIQEGGEEFQDLIKQCRRRCIFFNNRIKRVETDIENLIKRLVKIAKVNETQNLTQQEREHTAVDDVNKTGGCNCKEAEQLDDFQNYGKRSEKRGRLEISHRCVSPGQCHKDINVMLLGLKGTGKTTTIWNILNKPPHERKECLEYTGESFGLKLRLVECPGFDQNPDEIKASIQKGLSICAPGPDVILLVLKVGRFTDEIKQIMKYMKDTLEEQYQKLVIILFTRKDDLQCKCIDEFIAESEELKMLVRAYDNRVYALDNRGNNTYQVKELMKMFCEILKNNDNYCIKTQNSSAHCSVMAQEDTECRPSEIDNSTQEDLKAPTTDEPMVTLV